MKELDDYAYLWDGSDPGWRVRHIHHRVWRLEIVFGHDGPSTSEIRALRKLLPSLGSLPAREAFATLEGTPRYQLAEPVGAIERRWILDRTDALGLTVEATAEDLGSSIPVRNDEVLLIEDDDVAREVVARMQAAGVRMEHIEVD